MKPHLLLFNISYLKSKQIITRLLHVSNKRYIYSFMFFKSDTNFINIVKTLFSIKLDVNYFIKTGLPTL